MSDMPIERGLGPREQDTGAEVVLNESLVMLPMLPTESVRTITGCAGLMRPLPCYKEVQKLNL